MHASRSVHFLFHKFCVELDATNMSLSHIIIYDLLCVCIISTNFVY